MQVITKSMLANLIYASDDIQHVLNEWKMPVMEGYCIDLVMDQSPNIAAGELKLRHVVQHKSYSLVHKCQTQHLQNSTEMCSPILT